MHNGEAKILDNSTFIMSSKICDGSKVLYGDKCWLDMVDLLIPLKMFSIILSAVRVPQEDADNSPEMGG